MSDDLRLLRKVAILYYKNDLTQNDIAHRLGFSPQSVGRALQRVREIGVMRIEMDTGTAYEADLENPDYRSSRMTNNQKPANRASFWLRRTAKAVATTTSAETIVPSQSRLPHRGAM